MSKSYIFIIDTDCFAYNFYRELCAYITGVTGESNYGLSYVNYFLEEEKNFVKGDERSKFLELCEFREKFFNGEEEIFLPCSIWETPGWIKYSYDGCYPQPFKETDNDIEKKMEENFMSIPKDYRLSKETIKDYPLKQEGRAYLSVAIFFNKKLDVRELDILRRRSSSFPRKVKINKSWYKTFKITGFRMLEEERRDIWRCGAG